MPYKDLDYQKKYYERNKEKFREHNKEYYQKNKKRIDKKSKEYYQKNKDEMLGQMRKYYKTNKQKLNRQTKKYKEENRDKILVQPKKYLKKRYRNDIQFRLNQTISSAMWKSLKINKGGLHWESLVNYTLKDLIRHLEKQFTIKMSWNNYGSYWHIDHKIPKSVFNFDNYNQLDFKRCWTLSNLRPLEKIENRLKRNKINKPFQPSIKI